MELQFSGKQNKMRALLLIPILFGCRTSTSEEVKGTYVIKQDGVLVEKRHVDNKGKTISIVTYDIETKNPTDSIDILYLNQDQLGTIKVYSFVEGKYEVNELRNISDFYREVYTQDSLCDILQNVRHKLLLEDILSNICSIQGSVLPNGENVSSLAVKTENSDLKEIKYANVEARFNNLSETIQSYFYNEIMKEFSLYIKDGYLQKEEYRFTNGIFSRTFFYNTGRLTNSEIEVKYRDGSIRHSTRVYDLE